MLNGVVMRLGELLEIVHSGDGLQDMLFERVVFLFVDVLNYISDIVGIAHLLLFWSKWLLDQSWFLGRHHPRDIGIQGLRFG